jgi:hypothetical protein
LAGLSAPLAQLADPTDSVNPCCVNPVTAPLYFEGSDRGPVLRLRVRPEPAVKSFQGAAPRRAADAAASHRVGTTDASKYADYHDHAAMHAFRPGQLGRVAPSTSGDAQGLLRRAVGAAGGQPYASAAFCRLARSGARGGAQQQRQQAPPLGWPAPLHLPRMTPAMQGHAPACWARLMPHGSMGARNCHSTAHCRCTRSTWRSCPPSACRQAGWLDVAEGVHAAQVHHPQPCCWQRTSSIFWARLQAGRRTARLHLRLA